MSGSEIPDAAASNAPARIPMIELEAAAWELEAALGLPFVSDGSNLIVEPHALARWWSEHRDNVLRAYEPAKASEQGESDV